MLHFDMVIGITVAWPRKQTGHDTVINWFLSLEEGTLFAWFKWSCVHALPWGGGCNRDGDTAHDIHPACTHPWVKLGHLKQDRAYWPRLRLSVSQYEHIIFYFQALSKFHGDPNKNTTCNHSCHTMIVEANKMPNNIIWYHKKWYERIYIQKGSQLYSLLFLSNYSAFKGYMKCHDYPPSNKLALVRTMVVWQFKCQGHHVEHHSITHEFAYTT